MYDPRFDRLASVLIGHSTRLQPGEHILVEAFDVPEEMVIALVRAARAAGGNPHVTIVNPRIRRELVRACTPEQLDLAAETGVYEMERMHAYVGLRGNLNASEYADVPSDRMRMFEERFVKPVHLGVRLKKKWVALRWPTPSMAQLARMSTEAFADYYFRVCTLDYARLARAIAPLKALMERTREVRLEGPGTDLRFSIEGIPAIPCTGENNIPDGEIFTAPVRESVDGVIAFNTPSLENGITFENIRLEFSRGKVVKAEAGRNTQKIDEILDTDAGARHVGEFAIGVNPYITEPMQDTLFDEKIAGSIHFTPGNAYDDADNGNRSAVHWDMVLLQDAAHGGGRISFDGVLIREDGLFVLDELRPLNPEELLKEG